MAIITGICLGVLFGAFVAIGDKNLATWTGQSKTMPELAPTIWCRPMASFAFATWLFFQCIGIFCDLLGTWFMIKVFLTSFLFFVIFSLFWKGYSFHEPFEGIDVRWKLDI
jgi:hypothetical protein